MNSNVLTTTARALLALLALAGLLVGVPVALAMVGWPLPTSLPTIAGVREALSGATISDAVLVKALTVVCWLAWFQLAVSVLVEVRAWAQGRAATSIPLAGVLQPMARRLVLSAMLVMGSARTAVPTVLPLQTVVATSAVVAPPAETVAPEIDILAETPAATSAPAGEALPTCVVSPRDSLWSLAEAHLGDGYRWREIYELNRAVAQLDGGALSDPDLIRPGWMLAFPADAQGVHPVAPPEAPAPAPPVLPPASDPAAESTSPAEPPATTAEAIAATDTSRPGENDGSATAPATPAEAEPQTASAPATPAEAEPQTAPAPSDGAAEESGVPVPIGIAGVGLLAAGVVATLDRLRRVQQRRRRPGTTIPLPDADTAQVERQLRVAAAAAPADHLDVALRALSACLASRTSRAHVAIEAVSTDDHSVEILFGSTVEAPSGPFEVTAAGRSWTIRADADAADLASRRPAPAPALVSIGRIGERELLIDLEAHPRTALVGEAAEARSLLTAMVLELTTNRWADDVRVVLVGNEPTDALPLERLQVVRTIGEAFAEIEAESSALTVALHDAGHPSTLAARLSDVADGWVPTIVLVSDSSDPDLGALLALAESSKGIAVVVAGDPGPAVDRTITLFPGSVRLSPPDLEVAPLGLAEAEISAINTMLAVAASEEHGEEIILATDLDGTAPRRDVPLTVALTATKTRHAEVEVRVLGTPEIEGGKEPVDRKKSKELVVYLALHPDGVDESQLKAALWPGQVPTSGSFNQTVSKARLCLGRTEDGVHHLPHVADGRYRVGPSVGSDIRRLEVAFAKANVSSADDVIDELAAALGAVRGTPFAGATGYEWAHADGYLARIEAIVADAALLLSEWCYDRRDAARALWAAGQGLLASPGDERLFRMRMRAHDLAGNPAGVESVMEELCRVVESLEPHDDLHPETVALYEELSRRRRRTG